MNDRIAFSTEPARHDDASVTTDRIARAVFDTALDGLVVLDLQGEILAYNASFLALWNFPSDMLARRDASEMRAYTAQQLQDPARYLRSLEEPRLPGLHPVIEVLALKDGRVFERLASQLALADWQEAVVVRWRDISARHRAEQALVQSQARLSAVVEHALNAILLASDEGRYVDANPAACALTGYTRDELLAMSVSELVVPGSLDLDTVWAGFLQAGSSRGRVQLKRKDGTRVTVEFNAKAQVLPDLHLSILSDVTEQVHAHQQLEILAQTDALTGISNRRHFLARAADELARASRHGHPVAMLMIDLDHFKAINDRHGHAAGDEVLRGFAQAMSREIRQGETFARIGGEEFAVLLPQTGSAGAAAFAQRLLQTVRENPVVVGGEVVPYTASIGVAAWTPAPGAKPSIDALMGQADRALYRCKAAGRDRVEVCEEPA
jgi:diguanylate cyclase (GGDEF)-like protein/PAS domain S-box-containing protein